MRRIHSLRIPPSLPLPSSFPPPFFHPAPSFCLHPFLILSLPLGRPDASLGASFWCCSPSLPTSFGRCLRGLPRSQGKGGRRDSAPLPRRAGRLSEPRSESAGVTKERGASAREQKVPSGPRSWGMGPARGPGGWRRWSRTLRAAAGQSHQSAGRAARPATRSSLPEARAERGRLAAGLPPPPHRWAGGGGGSELFRASQPSVLPPPPGP